MRKIKDHSLYLVISAEYGMGRGTVDIADRAISGGADLIQMREKDKPEDDLIRLAGELLRLCRERGAAFIVNDDPLLAKKVNADGVHLGQGDMQHYPVKEARRILGGDRMIGISTHSVDEFEKANEDDVDYIAFGPIFPTKTKDYFIGAADIRRVLAVARKPVFFIGGITLSNIDSILSEGARNVALIRGITESDDIASTVKAFKEKLKDGEACRGRHIKDRR